MPKLNNYHIMISHSWDYSEDYETVMGWLDDCNCFEWSNYSVPVDNKIDVDTNSELKEKLENRIKSCSCLIVLSGMYAAYSKWIEFEIKTARTYGKPIIAVRPRNQERVPEVIHKNATTEVGWYSTSVVNAVRNYGLRIS